MPQIDLNSLFQSDPASQELGLGFLGQEQQMNDAKLAQQLFETEKGKTMLPAELANKQANTALTTSTAQGQDITNQFDLANMKTRLAQHAENLRKTANDTDYEQLSRAAPAFKQTGEFLAQMPGVASHATARRMLGSLYDPSFDQIPPQALGQVISLFGQTMEQMKTTDPEYQLKQRQIEAGNESKKYVADRAAQARVEAATIAARTKVQQLDNELAKIREKAKTGSYSQQSGYYTDLAQQAAVQAAQTEDETTKQALLQRAQVFAQIAEDAKNQEIQKAVAAAIEANRRAIDPAGLQKGEIRPVTPPKGTGTASDPIKLD